VVVVFDLARAKLVTPYLVAHPVPAVKMTTLLAQW
jgi:hypothetical protein